MARPSSKVTGMGATSSYHVLSCRGVAAAFQHGVVSVRAEDGPSERKDLSPHDYLGPTGNRALRPLDRWAALNMVAEERELEAADSQ